MPATDYGSYYGRCQQQCAMPGTMSDASKTTGDTSNNTGCGAFDTLHSLTNFSRLTQCLQHTMSTKMRGAGKKHTIPAKIHDPVKARAMPIITYDARAIIHSTSDHTRYQRLRPMLVTMLDASDNTQSMDSIMP